MASHILDEDEIPENASELDAPIVEDESDCSISSREPSQCRHEGTVKLVSIVFAGKPQLVQMASYDSSTSRRGLSSAKLQPLEFTSLTANASSASMTRTPFFVQCDRFAKTIREKSELFLSLIRSLQYLPPSQRKYNQKFS
ncbi:hypothetical protein OIDMADRAFT_46791 [Oidiodendron maius Zn]|uniref:Uncharacterized protein n=1 Tax=Oidiodendron maius (strain Zn) TaxID=913774 RepID=A0A0C3HXB0_OIDMZ|nr:hypothetical protein OIDMADRAFT_46791 [Oidiodendron maius Zn]